MPQAWDISTGGLTAAGDTIVVAVLDDGFDLDHEDLSNRYWINRGELPEDGIDNDQNGYVDDYRGLYLQSGSDDHPRTQHGTAVAGIIGAGGNNATGISGVNWDVRILAVSGIDRESDIIEGYGYIKRMREQYNASNGAMGAFIVATNLSAGINNAFAVDHPEWCALYDDLGRVGILNVAATTNKNENVDEEGDMPSTCTSDYLVVVTNTDITDNKLLFAGFGPESVDLGAPGTTSRTTDINSAYFDFESTSAAAPHVAGAVGLMYATDCTDFLTFVREDPGQAALRVRTALMSSVDGVTTLAGITVAGGRLNVFGAMTGITAYCGGATGDLAILNVYPNPQRGPVEIAYQSATLDDHLLLVFDAAGREITRRTVLPPPTGVKSETLDTSNLPAGVYVVSLIKGDNIVSSRIIVP